MGREPGKDCGRVCVFELDSVACSGIAASNTSRVTIPDACCPLQVRCIDLQEPQGWVVVPLPPDDNPE